MNTYTIEEYKNLLRTFDTSYEFSDDGLRWDAGNAQYKMLLNIQELIDPTGEIWYEVLPKTEDNYMYAQPKVKK